MKTKRNIGCAWIILLVATGYSKSTPAATPAQESHGASRPEAPIRLESIVVIGSAEPLDLSVHRVRALLGEFAPCLGCDALSLTPKGSFAARLFSYARVPASLPDLDRLDRMALDIRFMDHPELEDFRW